MFSKRKKEVRSEKKICLPERFLLIKHDIEKSKNINQCPKGLHFVSGGLYFCLGGGRPMLATSPNAG